MKLFVLTLVLAILGQTGFAERIVCYYLNWSRYGSEPFLIENINPELCTHIVYSFWGLDSNGNIIPIDPWNDLGDDWTEGGLKRFTKLRKIKPSVKLLLGVGGWNEGPFGFQEMVKSPEKRKAFLSSTLSFLSTHGLDGLEIDWIYHDISEGTPADKEGFSKLLNELKPEFKKNSYTLGVATSADPKVFNNSYDISSFNNNVDYITILSYDLHGSWDGKTGHVSPLYAMKSETPEEQQINVEAIVNRYIEKGAKPEKLNVGIVGYGRTFTLASPYNNGFNAPIKGPGKEEPLFYRKFCDQDNKKQWNKFRNDEQAVPYAVSGDQWVGYEDTKSLIEKVKFSKLKKLGGISFWALNMDDFKGTCGYGKFPLLKAVAEQILTK